MAESADAGDLKSHDTIGVFGFSEHLRPPGGTFAATGGIYYALSMPFPLDTSLAGAYNSIVLTTLPHEPGRRGDLASGVVSTTRGGPHFEVTP